MHSTPVPDGSWLPAAPEGALWEAQNHPQLLLLGTLAATPISISPFEDVIPSV